MNVTGTGAKHSQPNQSEWGLPQRDSAEHKEYAGVCSPERITENNITDANEPKARLLERILESDNLNQAYKRVKANKGAGGVDKMQIEDLLPYLVKNGEAIKQAIMEGKYKPNPVRRVEIPKDDGKTRPLGIPTVVDRVIQQAIAQVLSPIFEQQFSDNSYGFRLNRSAHGAIKRSQENIADGYKYVVDMDLEQFFDKVNQSKLIEVLGRTIKDGRVISLIHKYLNAGAVVKHSFRETAEGVPQGGPLSPQLSNIMLNELDKELTQRGHRFVRYSRLILKRANKTRIFFRQTRKRQRSIFAEYMQGADDEV